MLASAPPSSYRLVVVRRRVGGGVLVGNVLRGGFTRSKLTQRSGLQPCDCSSVSRDKIYVRSLDKLICFSLES